MKKSIIITMILLHTAVSIQAMLFQTTRQRVIQFSNFTRNVSLYNRAYNPLKETAITALKNIKTSQHTQLEKSVYGQLEKSVYPPSHYQGEYEFNASVYCYHFINTYHQQAALHGTKKTQNEYIKHMGTLLSPQQLILLGKSDNNIKLIGSRYIANLTARKYTYAAENVFDLYKFKLEVHQIMTVLDYLRKDSLPHTLSSTGRFIQESDKYLKKVIAQFGSKHPFSSIEQAHRAITLQAQNIAKKHNLEDLLVPKETSYYYIFPS